MINYVKRKHEILYMRSESVVTASTLQ